MRMSSVPDRSVRMLDMAGEVQSSGQTHSQAEAEESVCPSHVVRVLRGSDPTKEGATSHMPEQALREPRTHAGGGEEATPSDPLTAEELIWGRIEETVKEDVVKIVDGGAFAWTYGLKPFSAWLAVRPSYANALICWDSSESVRRDQDATYKLRREQRRKADPLRLERRESVERFVAGIKGDIGVGHCELAGFEADDLVAIHYLHAKERGQRVAVFGIDKDLLQLPGIDRSLRHFDGSDREARITDYPRRAPKFWPGTRDHRDLILYQLLFGDRSDSITRLLERGDRVTARKLHGSDTPFVDCYALWGRRVLDSLALLLMPSPRLHRNWEEFERYPESLLLQVEDRSYWEARNFPHSCRSENIQ